MKNSLFTFSLCSSLALLAAQADPLFDDVCRGYISLPQNTSIQETRNAFANLFNNKTSFVAKKDGYTDTLKLSEKTTDFINALKAGNMVASLVHGVVKGPKVPHDHMRMIFRAFKPQDNKRVFLNETLEMSHERDTENERPNVGNNKLFVEGGVMNDTTFANFINNRNKVVVVDDAPLVFTKFVGTGPLSNNPGVLPGLMSLGRVFFTHVENKLKLDNELNVTGGTYVIKGQVSNPEKTTLENSFEMEINLDPKTAFGTKVLAFKDQYDNKQYKTWGPKILNELNSLGNNEEVVDKLFTGWLNGTNFGTLKMAILENVLAKRGYLTPKELKIALEASKNTPNTLQKFMQFKEKISNFDNTVLNFKSEYNNTQYNMWKPKILDALNSLGNSEEAVDKFFTSWLNGTNFGSLKMAILENVLAKRGYLTPKELEVALNVSKNTPNVFQKFNQFKEKTDNFANSVGIFKNQYNNTQYKTWLPQVLNALNNMDNTPVAVDKLFTGWLNETNFGTLKTAVLENVLAKRGYLTPQELEVALVVSKNAPTALQKFQKEKLRQQK